MQVFVRDSSTLALEVSESARIRDLKAAFALKAYGADISYGLVLVYDNRQLDDNITLHAASVSAGATLTVSSRLRGGGGDGGSTGAESRSCYLEMYAQKKPDKVNPVEELLARSTRCRVSGERLAPPCVADELGSLFNKEALVHALLNKAMPAALAHITSLKSVVNLKLDPVPCSKTRALTGAGPSSSNSGKNGSSSSCDAADFQCPLTGLELNGRFPFYIHRPSGVVLSDRALREVPAACEELLGGKWSADDLIPVNPQGNELEKRQQQVAAALATERAKKKAKKVSKDKDKAAAAAVAAAEGSQDQPADAAVAAGIKRLPAGPPAAVAATNGVVAKKLKLPPGATKDVYSSIFCSGKQQHSGNDFLVRGAAKGV